MRPGFTCLLGVLMAAGGCKGSEPVRLIDTGWFDEATVGDGCQDRVQQTLPADGAEGWYWRDRPSATVATDRVGRYTAWLVDENEQQLPTEAAWVDTTFTLEWDGWLAPSTSYTFLVKDCVGTQEIGFTTSAFGTPLEASVALRAYLLELDDVDWVEPSGVGSLVALYLDDPILLQVQGVVDDQIRLIGAPGRIQGGELRQDNRVPTWNFGQSDFSDAPFFSVTSERVTLQYRVDGSVTDIPIEGFVFEGTFSADGTAIGGGVLAGRADTRGIGEILSPGNPGRLCELAAASGIDCGPCEDGEPFCLDLLGRNVGATYQPSVSLVYRAP